jgi:hypothetical protein
MNPSSRILQTMSIARWLWSGGCVDLLAYELRMGTVRWTGQDMMGWRMVGDHLAIVVQLDSSGYDPDGS